MTGWDSLTSSGLPHSYSASCWNTILVYSKSVVLQPGSPAISSVIFQHVSQISTHFSGIGASVPSAGAGLCAAAWGGAAGPATVLGQLLAAEVSTTASLLPARCLHMGGPAVCTGEGLCAAAGGGTASSSSVFSTMEGLSAAT